ncbi:tape measure protein [Companilactobacillus allii]|uniref:Tape measure protein N-terminal domain-containing protein n=1 Tax=Companilactobacillus allii TaxID=1847728 RepID=A0A1P8Q2K5_9LACO|nr:tape measure protein [Companilactobacillus allii]APX72088.1 hypothetical protein BTM29_05700 [Companilactobacillus allii]USQ69181.1 tape measure protein [Companilactobacillus allii]
MPDIVVNKIIKYSAEDALTPVANRLKSVIDNFTKNHTTKFDGTFDDTKIKSFKQEINGLPKEAKTELNAMAEQSGFRNFNQYLKSLPKIQQTKLEAMINKSGFTAFKAEYKSLPNSKKTELQSIAKIEGFKNFDDMYRKVPKEATTKLKVVSNKNSINQFENAIKKIPDKHKTTLTAQDNTGGVFSRLFGNLRKSRDEATKTHGIFGSVFGASIISSAAISGFGTLKNAISSAKDEAVQYAHDQQTMNATWLTLTGNADKGKKMVDITNQMASAANNSVKMVDELNQKFYSVTDNVGLTKNLTNSVLTLQDAFGKTDDAVMNFGTQWGQMEANGKVSAQDMMSFVNVFPKIRQELLKTEQKMTGNSNLTMQQMNDMMSAGKISSDTMNKVLTGMAGKYGDATKNFGSTIDGMGRTIKTQVPLLLSSFTKPFVNAESPIYKAVSDWISDPKTKSKFADLGTTVSTGMNNVMKAFSGGSSSKDISKGMNNAIDNIQAGFKSFFEYIAKHADDIKTVAKSLGTILSIIGNTVFKTAGIVFETIADSLGLMSSNSKKSNDPLKTFADIMGNIAKHQTAIKVITTSLLALFAAKKISSFASSLGVIKDNLGKIAGTKLTNLGGLKDANTYLGAEALKPSNAKATVGMRMETMSTAGKVATGAVGVGIAASAGIDIYKAIKTKNPTKKFEEFGKATGTVVGGGIGFMLGGPAGAAIGSQIGGVLGKAGGNAAKQFGDEWGKAGKKDAKPPDGLVPKASYYARKAVDGMTAWGRGIADWVKKHKEELILTMVNPFLGIADWLLKDTKSGKKFQKWVSKIVKDIQSGFKSFNKKAEKIGSNIVDGIVKGMKGFGKLALYALALPVGIVATIMKPLSKPLKKVMTSLSKDLKKDWKGFTSWLGDIFDPIAKIWDKSWKKISKVIKPDTISKNVSNELGKMSKDVKKSKWAQDLGNDFDKAKKTANTWGSNMGSWWSDFSSDFSKSWNSTWSNASTHMSKKFSGLKKWYGDFSGGMNSWWSQFSSSFSKSWKSVWQGISDTFKDIFDGLKKIAKNSWNGIITVINNGIGAINGVITTFGGSKLGTIKKLETGSNYHPGGLARINDANSPVYREIVKNKDGHMYSPIGRNVVVPLEAGSSVLPAQQSRPYVESGMIPAYENGIGDNLSNFFDSATGGISDKLSDAGSWVTSKVKDIGGDIEKGIKFAADFIKDPIGNLTKAFESVTDGKFAKEEFSSKMGPATGKGIVKGISDKVKSLATSFKKSLESVTSSSGSMPAGSYGSMIRAAAAYMHQSVTDFNVDMIERIIGNESGGNPKAINLTDSNAKAGHPSKGILQYIDGTFKNYAMPGHTDIWNPMDQLIALFNDATWRSDMGMGYNGKYGEWRGSASGPSGPRLMAEGAHVWNATNAIIGESGDEFAINPSKASALPLTASLINRLSDFHPQLKTSSLTSNLTSNVGDKLTAVINLLSSINDKDYQPQLSLTRTSSDMNQQNKRDTDIYAYQQGRRQ